MKSNKLFAGEQDSPWAAAARATDEEARLAREKPYTLAPTPLPFLLLM
jgi:hypothetical protein